MKLNKFTGKWIPDPGPKKLEDLEHIGYEITYGVKDWEYPGDDRRGQVWVFRGGS